MRARKDEGAGLRNRAPSDTTTSKQANRSGRGRAPQGRRHPKHRVQAALGFYAEMSKGLHDDIHTARCADCGFEFQRRAAETWKTRCLRCWTAGKQATKPAQPFRSIAHPPITGPKYKPACGQCDVPPWERCACSEVA